MQRIAEKANPPLDRIGEILSRGVARWLSVREATKVIELPQVKSTSHEIETASDPIVSLCMRKSIVTTGDLINELGLTRTTARRRLAEMVSEGKIVSEGKGRGAHYRLCKENVKT